MRIREQIPITRKRIYLDNAGAGPPTLPVINAMDKFLQEWRDHGSYWHKWLQEVKILGGNGGTELGNRENECGS